MNDPYQDVVTKFLCIVDFVAPIRTLKVKSRTKPHFDIDFLNVIRNRDKHYKKINRLGIETDKGNFKCAKLSFKKQLIRKNFTLKKKL